MPVRWTRWARPAELPRRPQRNRSFSAGITRSRIEPSPRVNAAPRTIADRARRGLAEDQLSRRGELVGHGPDGRSHDPAIRVRHAAQVVERQQPGDADRDVDDAPAPWPSERIRHDDGHIESEALQDRGPDARRRGIRVTRQERDKDVGGQRDQAVGVDEPHRALAGAGGAGDRDAVARPACVLAGQLDGRQERRARRRAGRSRPASATSNGPIARAPQLEAVGVAEVGDQRAHVGPRAALDRERRPLAVAPEQVEARARRPRARAARPPRPRAPARRRACRRP